MAGKDELPEKGLVESALETAKNALSVAAPFFPPLGSISAVLESRIGKLRDERYRAYMLLIEEEIAKIPQQIVDSPQFKDAMCRAILHYMNEPSEKKRKFIEHLNNSLFKMLASQGDNLEGTFDMFFVFNELFDKLSMPALDCLVRFKERFGKRATRYEMVDYFKQLHPIHGKRAFMELVNESLLEDEQSQEQPPSFNLGNSHAAKPDVPIGQRIYTMQPLGAVFTDWLLCDVGRERANPSR